jgi:hypothetical protein
MKILKNKEELKRLHHQHNNAVKDQYKCTFDNFCEWLSQDGHEDEESEECYIEIQSNETLSGNAVILDW